MNANMNLSLNPEELKKLLPALRKAQPYIFGLFLIGAFGYTAYAVNAALNVQSSAAPAAVAPTASPAAPKTKIVFDKDAIASLKQLNTVSGEVPVGSLGSSDPFR
jgi:hypothetical protein